jgi:hypothetical protein
MVTNTKVIGKKKYGLAYGSFKNFFANLKQFTKPFGNIDGGRVKNRTRDLQHKKLKANHISVRFGQEKTKNVFADCSYDRMD